MQQGPSGHGLTQKLNRNGHPRRLDDLEYPHDLGNLHVYIHIDIYINIYHAEPNRNVAQSGSMSQDMDLKIVENPSLSEFVLERNLRTNQNIKINLGDMIDDRQCRKPPIRIHKG